MHNDSDLHGSLSKVVSFVGRVEESRPSRNIMSGPFPRGSSTSFSITTQIQQAWFRTARFVAPGYVKAST